MLRPRRRCCFRLLSEGGPDLRRAEAATATRAYTEGGDTIRMQGSYTAYVEWDPDTRLYVGTVPGLPGAHTQAGSLDELRSNLSEVVALCLEAYQGDIQDLPHFVGLQQVEIAG
jgi:predicted RNase H-like HicB family nuclease